VNGSFQVGPGGHGQESALCTVHGAQTRCGVDVLNRAARQGRAGQAGQDRAGQSSSGRSDETETGNAGVVSMNEWVVAKEAGAPRENDMSGNRVQDNGQQRGQWMAGGIAASVGG
jgi:hypothetical protein